MKDYNLHTILRLPTIQGKLTEQLPSDGDARELYARIQEEKETLIKEGKIKKQKPLPPITPDEIPFNIPKSWKCVNNHAHVLGYFKYDYLDFVMHYINSIGLRPYVTGSAQPKLNQDNMNRIIVPLPPLAEQQRIADKIDEILSVISA